MTAHALARTRRSVRARSAGRQRAGVVRRAPRYVRPVRRGGSRAAAMSRASSPGPALLSHLRRRFATAFSPRRAAYGPFRPPRQPMPIKGSEPLNRRVAEPLRCRARRRWSMVGAVACRGRGGGHRRLSRAAGSNGSAQPAPPPSRRSLQRVSRWIRQGARSPVGTRSFSCSRLPTCRLSRSAVPDPRRRRSTSWIGVAAGLRSLPTRCRRRRRVVRISCGESRLANRP